MRFFNDFIFTNFTRNAYFIAMNWYKDQLCGQFCIRTKVEKPGVLSIRQSLEICSELVFSTRCKWFGKQVVRRAKSAIFSAKAQFCNQPPCVVQGLSQGQGLQIAITGYWPVVNVITSDFVLGQHFVIFAVLAIQRNRQWTLFEVLLDSIWVNVAFNKRQNFFLVPSPLLMSCLFRGQFV